ncbi:bifunctional UDP-N-acetylglucosamine diphosphorylase/glucosamine-1-phosphate N-acetyltransferase GlmU [Christensenellaceae bacterium OttesenSCG-928-K19]|nr:bifunctional UDP-N-acetylglucosamine diphosphorylase/glucosamine-1-phosphate N-acetyltransferase GlmU [Christensenellaceae bacterium OttesenSCG-928-K19]
MDCISVVLAAGEGTRMKSKKSKVLHEAAGLPILEWVLRAVRAVDTKKNILVLGRAIEEVKAVYGGGVLYAEQKERLGSGHAVMSARGHLEGFHGYTLIVAGDMPLLTGETITRLAEETQQGGYDCMLLSAELQNPFGYGRVIRNEAGDVTAIVEEKDATEQQRLIAEVNASCYCVKNDVLLKCLDRLEPKNAQNEYYLTDIVELINGDGGRVGAVTAADYRECMGVNDRAQLAEVSGILRGRINVAHMKNGVSILDPQATYIGPDVTIGQDTVVYPGVVLEGRCSIGGDAVLYPGSRIKDSTIGDKTTVQNSVMLDAKVGEGSTIGPYAYLRPGTEVGDHCRIGDFVEVKNSSIGDGTKVSHLTYIGDADFGKDINVGCGVVLVNYDGKGKYRSRVGDGAFIGCNTNLVSPVEVGEGAYIAAGATITEDVPPNSLAIARARQVNKTGWKDKREK